MIHNTYFTTYLQNYVSLFILLQCKKCNTVVDNVIKITWCLDNKIPFFFVTVIDNTKKHSSTLDAIKSIVPWAKRKAQSACTKKMLHKRLPILDWLPRYDSSSAIGDLVAGITVGLTLIPQGMAYANIAGKYRQTITKLFVFTLKT